MLFISKEVKVLLDRMDTNPEEFTGYDSKWEPFFPRGPLFYELNKVEKYFVRRKLTNVRKKLARKRAYERIMTTLVGGGEETPRPVKHDEIRAQIHADIMRRQQMEQEEKEKMRRHAFIEHMRAKGLL